MAGAERAIFVAINDNLRAWYEMLIPFVLSLRATDFDGRVVVIGYGLTAEKTAILRGQGVEVVAASSAWTLPLGRYIEVAAFCAAHPEIGKAALYDADIWFCSPRLDLFSFIDRDGLYACPDPLFCEFVIAPLIGPKRDENWQRVVTTILATYGHALQAGLVAGTTAAWADFAEHVRRCAGAIGTDFQNVFGLDTTFLHLWAAANPLVLLPKTQNFITRWGVAEVAEGGPSPFAASDSGEAIRAIHMAGNIRFFDRWRFYGNQGARALQEGAAFALAPGDLHAVPDAGPEWEGYQEACARHGLRLTGLRREVEDRDALSFVSTRAGLTILCEGNAEMTFEVAADTIDLNVYISHPSGFPSPIRRSVTCGGGVAASQNDLMAHYRYGLVRGTPITLSSTSLAGQHSRCIWLLSGKPEIEQ
ncbi:MAG: hypothetical protein INR70_09355 [Parafilimonas terrae]|nr:hypothetical protein [Parafilimonas terrae]